MTGILARFEFGYVLALNVGAVFTLTCFVADVNSDFTPVLEIVRN
jgi:hypothetical protein